MKPSEIRDRTDAELATLVQEQRQKLVQLNVARVTQRLNNGAQTRLIKRDIARILTIQHERERQAGKRSQGTRP